MSFLDNPFADAEEPPIVKGNPFGRYDVEQRERECLALTELGTSLEDRLRAQGAAQSARVAAQTQRTASLREELSAGHARLFALASSPTALSPDAAQERVGPPSAPSAPPPASASLASATATILADLDGQCSDCQAKAATLARAATLFRSRLLAGMTDGAGSAAGPRHGLIPLDEPSPAETEVELQARLQHDTSQLEDHVRQLIALQAATPDDADTALVAALLAHARGALQQHRELVSTVAACAARVLGQRRAAQAAAACEVCLRASVAPITAGASSGGRQRKVRRVETAPVSSMELVDAEAASTALRREIARIEAALAAVLRRGGAEAAREGQVSSALAAVSEPLAAVVQLAAAVQRREALAREADALGREVLLLREAVLGRTGAAAAEGALGDALVSRAVGLVTGGEAAGHVPPVAATSCGEVGRSLDHVVVSRVAAVDALWKSEDATVGPEAAAASSVGVALRTRLAFCDAFALLQDACLGALTSVNEQLQRQAFHAALLTGLAAHGTELSGPVAQRVLDAPAAMVPPPDSPAAVDRADGDDRLARVARWYLAGCASATETVGAAAVPSPLPQRLREDVERYGPLWAQRQAAWRRTCAALAGFLSLPPEPSSTHSAAVWGPAPDGPVAVRTAVSLEEVVEAEGREATAAAEACVQAVTAALEKYKAGLEKKLSWFGQQEHAKALKSLRALDKECSTYESRLGEFETVVRSAESARDQLPVLEEKLNGAKAAVSGLESEVAALQSEMESLRTSMASLSA